MTSVFLTMFFASKPASPEAICQAHGQDLEDCEPDGGSCPCHRPEGAKACEVPNVLTEKNHKNVSQLLSFNVFFGGRGIEIVAEHPNCAAAMTDSMATMQFAEPQSDIAHQTIHAGFKV